MHGMLPCRLGKESSFSRVLRILSASLFCALLSIYPCHLRREPYRTRRGSLPFSLFNLDPVQNQEKLEVADWLDEKAFPPLRPQSGHPDYSWAHKTQWAPRNSLYSRNLCLRLEQKPDIWPETLFSFPAVLLTCCGWFESFPSSPLEEATVRFRGFKKKKKNQPPKYIS